MGMLVNLLTSNFRFDVNSDNDGTFYVDTSNFVVSPIGFQIRFGLSFDANPLHGVGGRPTAPQDWTVGIVQNVVFEKLRLEYDDGNVFQTEFSGPALDSRARYNLPFVYDPPPHPASPAANQKGWRPLADIKYSSAGYDYFIDPWAPTKFSNMPAFVEMIDAPLLSAKLILNGAWIKKITRITSFQAWLIAKTPTSTFQLAFVPPVSAVCEYETDPPNFGVARMVSSRPSILRWIAYVEAGISKTVGARSGPSVRVAPGRGGTPVMLGETAGTRGQNWLATNKLI